jgi:hypothetical protein
VSRAWNAGVRKSPHGVTPGIPKNTAMPIVWCCRCRDGRLLMSFSHSYGWIPQSDRTAPSLQLP